MYIAVNRIVAPAGQTLLFPITAMTLVLSWIGHVVYGAVLGVMLAHNTSRAANMTRYVTA